MTPDAKPGPLDDLIKIGEHAQAVLRKVELRLCEDGECKADIRAVVGGVEKLVETLKGLDAFNNLLMPVFYAASAVDARADSNNLKTLGKALGKMKAALNEAGKAADADKKAGEAES
jgi:hypothetical protein